MPETTPETRLWRALVCVVTNKAERVVFRIPAFGHRRKDRVNLAKADLPPEIVAVIEAGPTEKNPGPYLHARVNIGAASAEDLRFEDWETS